MINRRHDDRASCPARHSLKSLLPMEPQIHAPATWKGGHESGHLFCLIRHSRIIAPIGAQWQAPLTERLRP
jgi:hypothetical protein